MIPKALDFRLPRDLDELAPFIPIELELLRRALAWAPKEPETSFILGIEAIRLECPLYIQHLIPKRGRFAGSGYRMVWEAFFPPLLDAYKAFARRFDLFVRASRPQYPHKSSFGYVRGKNILENAQQHCGARRIVHADVANFFPTITKERLEDSFLSLGIDSFVSAELAKFVSIDGSLPLGLPPSPILANYICLGLDDKLERLAATYDCTYTRYADDVSISGNSAIPSMTEVADLLLSEGFQLNRRKFRVTKNGQAHFVTGLSVSSPTGPHVPKVMKRRLRQEMYYCAKFGIFDHLRRIGYQPHQLQAGVNRLDGYVRYVGFIERGPMPNLRKNWKALKEKWHARPSYESIQARQPWHVTFYVDECEFLHDGERYLAICFVSTSDPAAVKASTVGILRKHLVGPFSDGKKEALKKKGLHFSDATEDLRKSYVDALASLPFNAYLAYHRLESYENYETVYLELVHRLLPHRLMWSDQAQAELIFEENGRVKRSSIAQLTEDVLADLERVGNRRPRSLRIEIGSKARHPNFSVPDFMLGVFARFATQPNHPGLEANSRETLFLSSYATNIGLYSTQIE